MNNNKWYRFLITEDKGPFDSSALQLFMPSLTQCNENKCSIDHFKTNMPGAISSRKNMDKPAGGLWTSTAIKEEGENESYSSDWTYWVQENERSWFNPQGILITPKSSNIFHIETVDDVKLLRKEFPLIENGVPVILDGVSRIDWNRILSDDGYDAIHWGKKNGEESGAYGFGRDNRWDVESTCWRIDAVKRGLIVPIRVVEIKKF